MVPPPPCPAAIRRPLAAKTKAFSLRKVSAGALTHQWRNAQPSQAAYSYSNAACCGSRAGENDGGGPWDSPQDWRMRRASPRSVMVAMTDMRPEQLAHTKTSKAKT